MALEGGGSATHALGTGRRAYVHVARGSVEIKGLALVADDGARFTNEPMMSLKGVPGAEVLIFDMA